jgi:hypothetical protein
MNEQRIEELSKEAWHQVDVSKIKGRHRAYTKIFAKLIVKEAMEVTKTYTSNQGWDYSAPVALARHFGVTE